MSDVSVRDAARQALEGITPGPWRPSLLDGVVHEDGSSSYRGGAYPDRKGATPIFLTNSIDQHDAEFIAAAPELVRGLIDELDRADSEVIAAEQSGYRQGAIHRHDYNRVAAERDAALSTLQNAWDEGFEAGATWHQSGPTGIPNDPPLNPYARILDGGAQQ
ncbi:ead/Ea22-like family protein [Gordonia insulae]|uniref:Uncharacterized protein n=1 Tax=Gordonia insulae TaxID=2420509 RepID=A0A3G8JG33_9ACTN|nr:hypothetical protein [Gordonia insulae]AZG43472.1 hypothetical protein D7316_00037 [Gordonia insulae]